MSVEVKTECCEPGCNVRVRSSINGPPKMYCLKHTRRFKTVQGVKGFAHGKPRLKKTKPEDPSKKLANRIRSCQECGKDYLPRAGNQRYCDDCRYEVRRKGKHRVRDSRQPDIYLECPVCGRRFRCYRGSQTCGKKSCWTERRRRMEAKRKARSRAGQASASARAKRKAA